ncbi:sodium-coupled neutral amino acid transporter [Pseudoscourfieldia marina]
MAASSSSSHNTHTRMRTRASLGSASVNLSMAVLGVGQLTLPYAASLTGLAECLLLLLVLTAAALVSLDSIREGAIRPSRRRAETRAASSDGDGEAALATPLLVDDDSIGQMGELAASVECKSTYAAILEEHMPSHYYKKLSDVALLLYAWGGSVSFLVVVKQQVHYITQSIKLSMHLPSFAPMLLLTAAVTLPLAMLRSVKALRYSSVFGSLAALFITAVVVVHNPTLKMCALAAGSEPPAQWEINPTPIVAALPLLAFALNTSWSYVPVFFSMSDDAQKGTRREAVRLRRSGTWLAMIVHSFVYVNYSVITVYGIVSFCGDVKQNVLDGYSIHSGKHDDWRGHMVLFARCALAVQLIFALPLRFHVARDVLVDAYNDDMMKVRLVTFALVASAAAAAAPPVPLRTAIGLTSAVCASVVIYIIPARLSFALYDSALARVTACAMAVFGVLVMVGGSYGSVMD